MLPEPPTTTEWWAAGAAAALVVVLGSLLLLGAGRRSLAARRAARVAGFLAGCVSTGAVLVFATLLGAAVRASMVTPADIESQADLPAGPFAAHLFNPDLATTERVGWISGAYLLPLAAVFGVLALALVDRHRSRGMRVAALVGSLVVALFGAYVALGTSTRFDTDPGPLAGRVAAAFLVVAVALAAATTVDLRAGRWSAVAPPAPPVPAGPGGWPAPAGPSGWPAPTGASPVAPGPGGWPAPSGPSGRPAPPVAPPVPAPAGPPPGGSGDGLPPLPPV